jgi:hypothetical protein
MQSGKIENYQHLATWAEGGAKAKIQNIPKFPNNNNHM